MKKKKELILDMGSAGGLAGIHHGINAIPEEWISAKARKEDIARLYQKFLSALESKG